MFVELMEYAQFFQVIGAEDAIIGKLLQELNQQNFCELVKAAECIGNEDLKWKALDFLSQHFLNLSKSFSLAVLDNCLFEQVVQMKSLMLDSEVDVLDSIFRWLYCRGHEIEEVMIDRYKDAKEKLIVKDTLPTSDVIDRMTRHVMFDEFTAGNLGELARLSRHARLGSFSEPCYQAFLNSKRTMEAENRKWHDPGLIAHGICNVASSCGRSAKLVLYCNVRYICKISALLDCTARPHCGIIQLQRCLLLTSNRWQYGQVEVASWNCLRARAPEWLNLSWMMHDEH